MDQMQYIYLLGAGFVMLFILVIVLFCYASSAQKKLEDCGHCCDLLKTYIKELANASGYRFAHHAERKIPSHIECVKIRKDQEADQCEKANNVEVDANALKHVNASALNQRGEMGGQRFSGPAIPIENGVRFEDRRNGKDRRINGRKKPAKKKTRKQTKRKPR